MNRESVPTCLAVARYRQDKRIAVDCAKVEDQRMLRLRANATIHLLARSQPRQ